MLISKLSKIEIALKKIREEKKKEKENELRRIPRKKKA